MAICFMGFLLRECIYQDSGSVGGLMCGWRLRRRQTNGADAAAVAMAEGATDNPMASEPVKETTVEMQQLRSLLSHSMKSDASGGSGAGEEDWKENEIMARNRALSPGNELFRMNQLEELVMQQQSELKKLKDLRKLLQSLLTK